MDEAKALHTDIIDKLREGNREAQEAVYRLLAPRMFALCLRYIDDRASAEDVLQESFIDIFTKINQFRGDGKFEGWCRRIFITHAIKHIKKQKHFSQNIDIETVGTDISDEENVELEEDATPTADQLMEMIQALPMQYRLVFNMAAIEGFSHKEIAERLSISEATSRSNLTRARKILQNKLQSAVKSSKIGGLS